jgi:Tfp pilus assembly protein PilF
MRVPETVFDLDQDGRKSINRVEHPTVLAPRNNLAMLLMNAGRLQAARAEFASLLKSARATVGEDHAMTAIFMSNEGLCLARTGRSVEARAELEDAHARLLKMFGADHARTRTAAERLAEVRRTLGENPGADARGNADQVVRSVLRSLPTPHFTQSHRRTVDHHRSRCSG